MHWYLSGNTLTQVNLTIAANISSYNAFTAAGSPTTPCAVTVTIASGIIVGGTTAAAPFQTGTWPAGSTFLLVNNGYIEGSGGAGNGGDGKDALDTKLDITIDNTNGYIRGGGGGGANGTNYGFYGYGGGGGGQGNPGGSGASGGAAPFPGSSGGSGSRSINGAGGNGGSDASGHAGSGGAGGGWGGNGQQSGADSGGNVSTAFGAGGKAIALNGHSVTWLGGNTASQVQGAVA